MMNILLGFMVFLAAGFGLCVWAAMRAPVGREDEQGFHYGPGQDPRATAEDFHGAMPALGR